MPVTVEDVLNKVGLKAQKPLKWNTAIPSSGNGVYIVSTSSKPDLNNGTSNRPKLCPVVLKNWKKMSPFLEINRQQPNMKILEEEISNYWHTDENILYIGESTSKTNPLNKRIKQFYDHKAGWGGPHVGGYWVKLLKNCNDLFVYYAECENPRETEFKMLMYFIESKTGKHLYEIDNLSMNLPFANLKVDFLKRHNITGATKRESKSD